MKKLTIVLAVLLAAADAARGQGAPIYDENTVATYRLTMAAADWKKIVDDPNGAGDLWQRASMTWKGQTLNDIAVKAVGLYSRVPGNPKPSIRLKFDEFVPGRRWYDVDSVKLDSMIGNTDSSMMVDRLAYWVYRQMGLAAPRSCHARLYVNGNFKGLYEVEEPVRKAFMRFRFGSANDDGNLYEISYQGMPRQRGDIAFDHYEWRGSSPSSYVPFPFVPKTNEVGGDYRDIVTLCDILNNGSSSTRRSRFANHAHLDEFLTYLAVLVATGDYDGLTSGGARMPNNHFWYHREDTNKLQLIPWDPGVSLGQNGNRSRDGSQLWTGPPGIKDDHITMDIYFRFYATVATSWIQNDSTAKAAYLAKLRQVVDGPMKGMRNRINFIYNQIKSHAYADPLKPFSNSDFDATVTRRRDDWIPRRIAYLESKLPSSPPPVGSVTGFTLMNAVTGQDIGPVKNGDTIDLAQTGPNLNIRANITGTVESVKFGLDGNANYRIDNAPPQYTLVTTSSTTGWTPSPGNHTVTARPYSQDNAGGQAGASVSIGLTVVDSTPPPVGSVTGFTLMNAATGQDVGPLKSGDTFDLAQVGSNLNIRAEISGAVESVRFGLDGNANYRIDNAPPQYTLVTTSSTAGWTPSTGSHTVTARPYSQDNAQGQAGSSVSITFTVVDSTPPPPTPVGSVTGFTLMNVATGQDIGPVADGDTIDLAQVGSNLNIRAEISGTVESVRFGLDGNTNYRIDNAPPQYTLVTTSSTTGWTPSTGSHTVTARPYSQDNAQGQAGSSVSITFTVVDSTPPPPTPVGNVTGFTLMNVATRQDIGPVADGDTIDLAQVGSNLNIRAEISGPVESVRFGLDGNASYRIDNFEPEYTLATTASSTGWTPSTGSHTVTARPYSQDDAQGQAGTDVSITFTVVDSTPPPPTPVGSVTGFTLMDVATGQDIGPVADGDTIDLAQVGYNLNIRAETTGTVESVRFGLDSDPSYRLDNFEPQYTLVTTASSTGWTPSLGGHTVTATPYSQDDAAGQQGTAVSITFTVIGGVGSGSGLTGEYYDSIDLLGAPFFRTDPEVNFDWGTGSPVAAVPPDLFSVRWTGLVEAAFDEDYTFYVRTDDGVRLWVDGALVIDAWVNQGATEWASAPVPLVVGQPVDIRMEYFENTGDAVAELRWSSASTPKQIIPSGRLYVKDSDGDGFSDAEEIITGYDPNDPNSFPGGGGSTTPPALKGPFEGSEGCGTTGFEPVLFFLLLRVFRRRRVQEKGQDLG